MGILVLFFQKGKQNLLNYDFIVVLDNDLFFPPNPIIPLPNCFTYFVEVCCNENTTQNVPLSTNFMD